MTLEAKSWVDATRQQQEQRAQQWLAAGYRMRALSIYTVVGQVRYACAMVKEPATTPHIYYALSPSQWLDTVSKERAEGYAPIIVSATGASTGPTFAAVFGAARGRIGGVTIESHLAPAQFAAKQNEMRMARRMLRTADAYGAPGDVRYVAVWWPNTDDVAWAVPTIGAPSSVAQANFDAMKQHRARPSMSFPVPGGVRTAAYVDDSVGEWLARSEVATTEYEALEAEQAGLGRVPIVLAAHAEHSSPPCVSVVFAERATPMARSFRSTGANAQDVPNALIDAYMEDFVVSQRIKGAALAITQGTRLVYARGYTYGEAHLPTVTPRHRFRLASVTKVFTAAAIWQLLEKGSSTLSLDDTLQSILNLKTPSGGAPVDSRFADITVRHLLEGTSGISKSRPDVEAANAFNAPLPATLDQHLRYYASLMLDHDPGDDSQADYRNNAYRMLGAIVAKKRGTAGLLDALRTHLFAPLGITRIESSITPAESQPAEHVRHYDTQVRRAADNPPLQLVQSVSHADRRLAPRQYGAIHLENYVGSGGLSAAVVDLARLGAAFSDRRNNPMMDFATVQQWMTASLATFQRTTSGWGFHGFDNCTLLSPANTPVEDRSYSVRKGGSLPTVGAGIDVDTNGGLGLAILLNTPRVEDDARNWREDIEAIAAGIDWGTRDRFPDYGMASLTPSRIVSVGSTFRPARIVDRVRAGDDH
ncbi:MAG: serine hydrolase [Gemmatimonadaceae bacterium]|jgi:CubicO group peptidase (beta-lactamase class C family)|nr:serine hydrolase [Gemmatimonadaceae bacterium]